MMRLPSSIGLALVLVLSLAGRVPAQDAASALAAAEEASHTILSTHFFTAGRGMHVFPGIFRLYELAQSPLVPVNLIAPARGEFGFNVVGRSIVGLFGVKSSGTEVAVMGCAGCHSGMAAGRLYVGIGNKNIDVAQIGRTVQRLGLPYRAIRHLLHGEARRLIDDTFAFTKMLGAPETGNLTQGMVPTALIGHWFYAQAGQSLPPVISRGAVKVPHFFGYGEKRKVGLFCDGLGDGSKAGWAALVELTAGQDHRVVREYYPRLEEAERLFEKLLPPRFPYPIDAAAAAQGAEVFRENCSACHGTYQRTAAGLPIYQQPLFVPWEVVRTDAERLELNSAATRAVVAASPLSDLVRTTNLGRGYLAPRLDGIWARFPYLHNASVPSLAAMLTPPDERPEAFSLRDSGSEERFDRRSVGLTLPAPGSREEEQLRARAQRGARDVYWSEREGHAHVGHPFGTALPAREKAQLIEYLKSL